MTLLAGLEHDDRLNDYDFDEEVASHLLSGETLLTEDISKKFNIITIQIDVRDLHLALLTKRHILGEQCGTRMNHLFISKLITNMAVNKKFFEIEVVQRIIELQFKKTKRVMMINGGVYLILFYLPFIWLSFSLR